MEITFKLIGIVVASAAAVAGIIEWIKAGMELFSRPKPDITLKAILPWALLPVTALGTSACFDGGLFYVLATWIMTWAFAQIAYPVLIKLPHTILEYIKNKVGE